MDKKNDAPSYREERKQRLAKAAKKKNMKKGDTTDLIAGIIKAIAIVAVIGILCAGLYIYGVPQSIMPALKVGDRTYTMSEYSYYYSTVFQTYANTAYSYVSQYGFNLSGFDYTISPADQTTKDDDGNEITWDEFFRNNVVETLETYNYYLDLAEKDNITLNDKYKEQVESDLSELASTASSNSLSTSRYISYMFGRGLNEKKFRSLLEDQYLVAQIIESQEDEIKEGITMEDIEAAYEADPSEYEAIDIRLLGIAIEKDEEAENTADDTTEAVADDTTEAVADDTTEAVADDTTEAAADDTTEAPAADDTTEAASEPETEAPAAEPSEAELIANEMLSKVTDEDSFIELCKEYCAEDQKATFEDPSASLAMGIKKTTVAQNIDEELADWLFSEERQVGDKRVFVASDYAYVIMIKNTAYREETPLVSARHILISYSEIANELAAEAATEADTTEAVTDEPASEETPADDTTAAPEETTPATDDTTEAAENSNEVLTASDGKEITADGSYSAEVVLKAYEKALEIYNTYLSGEKTEEAFAELAEQYSDDTGSIKSGSDDSDSSGTSTSEGGLYEDIAKGKMVAPFEEWVYDESRQPGDVGLVQTTYGWHVMYFVSSHEEAQWIEEIRDSIASDKQKEYEESVSDQIKGAASTTMFTKLAGNAALSAVEKLYGLK